MLQNLMWSIVESEEDYCMWVIQDAMSSSAPVTGSLVQDNASTEAHQACKICRDGRRFDSCIEALEHFHSNHMSCPNPVIPSRPFEDPCFALLRPVSLGRHSGDERRHWSSAVMLMEEFMNYLTNFKRLLKDIHCLVATVSAGSHRPETQIPRPSLPSNLVYAFEEIIGMYIITARCLSLANRRRRISYRRNSIRRELNDKVDRIKACMASTNDRTCERLQYAKKDIILLGTTPPGLGGLSFAAVGPEFLAAALAANLQNRPLLPSTLAPSASSRVTLPPRDDGESVVALYQRYSARLRYQAHRRPQRRVFLDIRGLEEELDALLGVTMAQHTSLANYKQLLAPNSLRITTTERVGLFKIEGPYIDAQLQLLASRIQDLKLLRDRAALLREQVKQAIEILEEGHGKAIRVFTIVTLLFLPLLVKARQSLSLSPVFKATGRSSMVELARLLTMLSHCIQGHSYPASLA